MTFWAWLSRFLSRWGFALFPLAVLLTFAKVAVPFVLALVLAYVLAPPVGRLSRIRIGGRKVPRFVAVLVIYVGVAGVLALFVGAFLPRLSGDFSRLVREAPPFFDKVKTDYAPRLSGWLERNFPLDARDGQAPPGPRQERKLQLVETKPGHYDLSLEGLSVEVDPIGQGRYQIGPKRDPEANGRLADLVGNVARSFETETMDVLKVGQRFVVVVAKSVAELVLILMVAAFLLVDQERLLAFARELVPKSEREPFGKLLVEVDRGLAGVIRGQLVICLVNGVLTYLGLLVLHVKYPLLLGILAAGMSIIPVFGSILSSVPIVAVALVAGTRSGFDLGRGAGTLGWIIGIHLFEANFLNPKIIGSAARIHPVVVVFALVAGEGVGGLTGALIAVPVASIVQTLFHFWRRRAEDKAVTG